MAEPLLVDLVWLVPVLTFLGFLTSLFLGSRLPGKGGEASLLFTGLAGLLSVTVGVSTWLNPIHFTHPVVQEMTWWSVGDLTVHVGTYVDNLTALLLFVVGILTTLIVLYSTSYMKHDREEHWIGIHLWDSRPRFFAAMSLFITGMYGFVLASNLLEAFIFWEIMGLCSYLLIGYWYFKEEAAHAATKAFLTTRVGDLFLFAGIAILFILFGSLDYEVLFNTPVAAGNELMLTVAMLCVFIGAVGKSAQVPLHVWLPDAMEGPTPVSALIHAATMVKAGVFLVARMYPLFAQVPTVLLIVAVVGAVTAFVAATMAIFNNDLKRVLAFSTVSQLGYMFLGLGAGAIGAAVLVETGHPPVEALGLAGFAFALFHLVNHAFFKALLFLGAGSVGHAVHTYDMREMGGLHREMPVTSWTMLIASLSIAGIVPFAGFWSKDELLAAVRHASHGATSVPAWWGDLFLGLYALGIITAVLTAYYMFRLWFLTFVGTERTDAAMHAHESPGGMTTPLVVLAVFAAVGGVFLFGFAGLEALPAFVHAPIADYHAHVPGLVELLANPWTYVGLAAAIVGILVAWLRFVRSSPERRLVADEDERGVRKLLNHRYYWSEAYLGIAHGLVFGFARVLRWFDELVIDSIVDGFGRTSQASGQGLRRWTTGNVADYALTVVAGLVVLILLVIYLPQITTALTDYGILGGI